MAGAIKTFKDRTNAGKELGEALRGKYQNKDVLVLGIPRGGVEVAYHVARVLNAELSVLVTKKLPHPFQQELAIGAIAEDGSVYLSPLGQTMDRDVIEDIIRKQTDEVKSRVQRFRKGKPLPDIAGRIVILVDDGIATGSTIIPAIELCKGRKAAQIIVAAPVSAGKDPAEIVAVADQVVVLKRPTPFYAVGQVYEDFQNLSDQQITSLLEQFRRVEGNAAN